MRYSSHVIALASTVACAIVGASAVGLPAVARAQTPAPAPAPAPAKQDSTPAPAVPMPSTPPQSAVPMPTQMFAPQSATGIDTVDRVVAVVGKTAITFNELRAAVNEARQAGMQLPSDEAGQLAVGRDILDGLVDQEVLVQKAHELKIEVSDAEVASQVDRQIKTIRSRFASEEEFTTELKNAGLGTPDEYRRTMFDQARRYMLQQRVAMELRKKSKPGSVTEAEVDSAYARAKDYLQRRPATVAFRQLVITPKPTAAADSAAKRKAEAVLAELKAGADFESVAKRESMDPGSKAQGGDLGWNRRGSGFVPEFERAMFSLPPGELSPLVKTSFGYHIIKVDRVQPAEVKVRHILIAPVVDSADVARAERLADSVAGLWRSGVSFDTLVAKFHDPIEEKGLLTPTAIDTLPEVYRTAIGNLQANQVTNPFPLRLGPTSVKFAIVQVVTRTAPGEYSLAEVRSQLRAQLADEKQIRAALDRLRHEMYVSIRL